MSSRKKTSKNTSQKLVESPLISGESWLFSESFKAARTNLTFILPGSDCKMIGITSAMPSVGKSVSAINLAISFGQVNKKTLLIDCDMRLPTVAAKLDIKATPGIADVLAGEALVSGSIQRIKKYNIDVLTAGNIPSDPTWLLQSEQLRVLLGSLNKVYDYIFIDFPPISSVSDALIVSESLDGYVMVVRENVSTFREISSALKQIEMVDGTVLGFLYNDAKTSSGKYYKNNYYYKRGGGSE